MLTGVSFISILVFLVPRALSSYHECNNPIGHTMPSPPRHGKAVSSPFLGSRLGAIILKKLPRRVCSVCFSCPRSVLALRLKGNASILIIKSTYLEDVSYHRSCELYLSCSGNSYND